MSHWKQARWPFVVFVLIEVVIFGSGSAVTKFAYDSITPLWCLAARFGLATAVFALFFGRRIVARLRNVKVRLWLPQALCLGCALAWEPMLDVAAVRPVAWGIIVFLALFSTCLAFFLQSLALDRLSSTTVSLLLTGEPVFTALFAYLFLGETLSAMGLLGAAVIVGTVVAATWADGRTGAPAAPAAPVVVSRRAVPRPRLLVSKRRDDRMAA